MCDVVVGGWGGWTDPQTDTRWQRSMLTGSGRLQSEDREHKANLYAS